MRMVRNAGPAGTIIGMRIAVAPVEPAARSAPMRNVLLTLIVMNVGLVKMRIRDSVTNAGHVRIVITTMDGTVFFVRNVIIQMNLNCVENAGFVQIAEAVCVIPVDFAQSVGVRLMIICIARNAVTVIPPMNSAQMKRIITV